MHPPAPPPETTALLVVDDAIELPLRCVLERSGHSVTTKASVLDRQLGREADEIDLLVLDLDVVDLPEPSRALGRVVSTPVVVVLTSGPHVPELTGLGGRSVSLTKPFTLPEFEACVRALTQAWARPIPVPRGPGRACEQVAGPTVVGQVPQYVV